MKTAIRETPGTASFCPGNRRWEADDHVHLQSEQFVHHLGKLVTRCEAAAVDGDGFVEHVAELTEALQEGFVAGTPLALGRACEDVPDPRHLPRLLRLGAGRRGEEAESEDGDERRMYEHYLRA